MRSVLVRELSVCLLVSCLMLTIFLQGIKHTVALQVLGDVHINQDLVHLLEQNPDLTSRLSLDYQMINKEHILQRLQINF